MHGSLQMALPDVVLVSRQPKVAARPDIFHQDRQALLRELAKGLVASALVVEMAKECTALLTAQTAPDVILSVAVFEPGM